MNSVGRLFALVRWLVPTCLIWSLATPSPGQPVSPSAESISIASCGRCCEGRAMA